MMANEVALPIHPSLLTEPVTLGHFTILQIMAMICAYQLQILVFVQKL